MMQTIRRLSLLGLVSMLLLLFTSCATPDLPSSAEINLRFSTQPAPIPENLVWATPGVAHELINIQDLMVVVSGGSNPIPEDVWKTYRAQLPWMKNIERNLLFTKTAFLRSPRVGPEAPEDDRYTFVEISGYTWLEIAQPLSIDFIPAGQTTDMLKPEPGHLVVKTIKKAQILSYSGEIYQLTDNQGNYYVMHATETGTPSLDAALPSGWTLKKVELSEDLIISPSIDGYYNILGDNLGQGYHQYKFSQAVWPSE